MKSCAYVMKYGAKTQDSFVVVRIFCSRYRACHVVMLLLPTEHVLAAVTNSTKCHRSYHLDFTRAQCDSGLQPGPAVDMQEVAASQSVGSTSGGPQLCIYRRRALSMSTNYAFSPESRYTLYLGKYALI